MEMFRFQDVIAISGTGGLSLGFHKLHLPLGRSERTISPIVSPFEFCRWLAAAIANTEWHSMTDLGMQ
jgi:hypothetical protein